MITKVNQSKKIIIQLVLPMCSVHVDALQVECRVIQTSINAPYVNEYMY